MVRKRGNAERLRRYWSTGSGTGEIRWNTPGDWTRCYGQLRKYMGVRAKGYCANLHKRNTGMWPGDVRPARRLRRIHGKRAAGVEFTARAARCRLTGAICREVCGNPAFGWLTAVVYRR